MGEFVGIFSGNLNLFIMSSSFLSRLAHGSAAFLLHFFCHAVADFFVHFAFKSNVFM